MMLQTYTPSSWKAGTGKLWVWVELLEVIDHSHLTCNPGPFPNSKTQRLTVFIKALGTIAGQILSYSNPTMLAWPMSRQSLSILVFSGHLLLHRVGLDFALASHLRPPLSAQKSHLNSPAQLLPVQLSNWPVRRWWRTMFTKQWGRREWQKAVGYFQLLAFSLLFCRSPVLY